MAWPVVGLFVVDLPAVALSVAGGLVIGFPWWTCRVDQWFAYVLAGSIDL